MNIIEAQTTDMIRTKVQDDVVIFPAAAIGHKIVAEGVLRKIELSKRKAIARMKLDAEEKNQPFDASCITKPMVVYQLEGKGALISDA